MTSTNDQNHHTWVGRAAQDRHDGKIGKVSQVYVEDQTGRPEWLASTPGCSEPGGPSCP